MECNRCVDILTILGEFISSVELIRGTDQMGDAVVLQQPDVVVHGAILININFYNLEKGENKNNQKNFLCISG